MTPPRKVNFVDVRHSFVNFVLLYGRCYDGNHCLKGWTTRFFAGKLAHRNGHSSVNCQSAIDPVFEVSNFFGVSFELLREELPLTCLRNHQCPTARATVQLNSLANSRLTVVQLQHETFKGKESIEGDRP
ncbi:MAG: hypothetical protein RBJ76_15730 [Stenomitos frigidus ULC029]